jgi:hypothetical protein
MRILALTSLDIPFNQLPNILVILDGVVNYMYSISHLKKTSQKICHFYRLIKNYSVTKLLHKKLNHKILI